MVRRTVGCTTTHNINAIIPISDWRRSELTRVQHTVSAAAIKAPLLGWVSKAMTMAPEKQYIDAVRIYYGNACTDESQIIEHRPRQP